jgi:hypothetical protein
LNRSTHSSVAISTWSDVPPGTALLDQFDLGEAVDRLGEVLSNDGLTAPTEGGYR